jgi:23S rRNA (cytidine1920-2'-O)/16S rRNA (cytidine1409-2'-O)-methyltransferase
VTDSTPLDRGRRADVFLVERGFAASRSEAQAAIAAGLVRADGVTVAKPAQLLLKTMHVDYAPPHTYVSRGALKLIAALDEFTISPEGLVCLDIGASTGGFTEVLLERGAAKVFAVDVGHGQLREKLAKDSRVVVMEGVNARGLTAAQIPQAPHLIVADVSFISLKLALSSALTLVRPGARLVALVKPQFEVGRARLGKGGIVKDDDDRRAACDDIQTWLVQDQKWLVDGTMESPVAGGDGNREFLIAARKP